MNFRLEEKSRCICFVNIYEICPGMKCCLLLVSTDDWILYYLQN